MGCNLTFPMKPNTNPGKTQLLQDFSGKGYRVFQFKTGELAIFSYLVESHGDAMLIDPTVDTDAYREVLSMADATLKYVALTHFHADYVAGHLEFKVPILMGEKALRQGLGFKVEEQKDGTFVELGEVKLQVLHTPGHTPESSCYLLSDRSGKQEILFTGDTLFLNEIGRPDLAVSSEVKAEDLGGLLFDSLQKLKALPPHIKILPGHGSGSSCGKSIGEGNVCTLETQLQNNYALQYKAKGEFIKRVLQDMPKPPQYFFHDAKLNQQGPAGFQAQWKHNSAPLTVEHFRELAAKGLPIVDTRSSLDELKKGNDPLTKAMSREPTSCRSPGLSATGWVPLSTPQRSSSSLPPRTKAPNWQKGSSESATGPQESTALPSTTGRTREATSPSPSSRPSRK